MAAGIIPPVEALRRSLLATESSSKMLLDHRRMVTQGLRLVLRTSALLTNNLPATAHGAGAEEGTDMRNGRSEKREDLGPEVDIYACM